MKIDSTHLDALLDPLGLEENSESRFVRIAYRATIVIFTVEAAIELAFPLLILYKLLF